MKLNTGKPLVTDHQQKTKKAATLVSAEDEEVESTLPTTTTVTL